MKREGAAAGRRPWQKSKPKSFAERDAKARENRRLKAQGRSGAPAHKFTHEVVLYGWHPVVEALRNPKRKVRKITVTENGHRRLLEELGSLPVEPVIVHPREIDAVLTPDAVHQGLLIEADPLKGPSLDAVPDNCLLLVLDQITDPHNVGAILRSAAAFGVDAVVTTERHSRLPQVYWRKPRRAALNMCRSSGQKSRRFAGVAGPPGCPARRS